jgi:hypothetical protein
MRDITTSDLSEDEQGDEQTTAEQLQAQYPEETRRGILVAARMDGIFTGHLVRRSYFYPLGQDEKKYQLRKAVTFRVTEVNMIGAGVVVIKADNGEERFFPALEFDFRFRADGMAVLCEGAQFSVLFEQVA